MPRSFRFAELATVAAMLFAAGPSAGADAVAAPGQREVLTSGKWSMVLPLGLQADAAYIPDDNPMSDDKIAARQAPLLRPAAVEGHDDLLRQLPQSRTTASPIRARPRPASDVQLGARNSPTVMNRLFSAEQFWDGRAADLEEQAHGPLTNPVEMAMGSHDDVVGARQSGQAATRRCSRRRSATTRSTCRASPRRSPPTSARCVSGNSPYDRYKAGDKDAMSAAAVRGMALFNGKANCKTCHAGFNFTDENYRNIGVGMDKPKPDLGRYEVTKKRRGPRRLQDADPAQHRRRPRRTCTTAARRRSWRWSSSTIAAATAIPKLSKDMKPLHLSDQEKRDLVAFMEALQGEVTNAQVPDRLPD